ncbi:HAD-superfamily hydrolase [Gigaspora margarita]|uniref:HAD-superfamily hydrolase n=1 Tax=Gigaspora margarita TaxID=4874 RepID=A0A8H3XFG7_GIGMA|nr:HAD-superfamily hydrolase [Gigaspora margarita]
MLRLFSNLCSSQSLLNKSIINVAIGHRYYSSPPCHYGICIDIDGVLIKGKKAIPEAKSALQFLGGENKLKKKIPYALLTNGGGMTESKKAEELSEILGVAINPSQLTLAHSPMCQLVPKFKDSEILVIGGSGDNCRIVAKSYGFNRVVLPNDILAWKPSIWPFTKLSENDLKLTRKLDFSNVKIEAVMVFHDSHDWGRDLQIVSDLLQSKDGYLETLASPQELLKQNIPLFFSNPDIIWSNDCLLPRLAQGSFRLSLEHLYKKITGLQIKYSLFGKPEEVTYKFAHKLLEDYSFETSGHHSPNRKIYAVGDNPDSDIAGANAFGWTSILVRTGLFKGDNHHLHPAKYVADNILQAVEWMFHQEEKFNN